MAYYNPYYYQYQYPYQQSYNSNPRPMDWVEGEVGAKAFQMPAGWPVNTPIALWDSTEKRIFLKSWNQMGMANQMQELTYEMKDPPIVIEGVSGKDMSNYVTKEDFEELKREIRNLSNNRNNRGGGNQ